LKNKGDYLMTVTGIREVKRTRYSVTYSATVDGRKVQAGGHAGWRQEDFVNYLLTQAQLSKSWNAVLAEDNFVSRAFGLY
jgi:hypothetical protein